MNGVQYAHRYYSAGTVIMKNLEHWLLIEKLFSNTKIYIYFVTKAKKIKLLRNIKDDIETWVGAKMMIIMHIRYHIMWVISTAANEQNAYNTLNILLNCFYTFILNL